MDALTLLEQDHQKVKKLMGEIEKTTERGIKTREQSARPRSSSRSS
jgi:hypothetical protein